MTEPDTASPHHTVANVSGQPPLDVDIAIVGAGMVGATLAALLDQAGFSVALIDARPAPTAFDPSRIDSRVSAVTQASRALFTSLGVWKDIEARRVSPYRHMQVWDSEGSGEVTFSASDVGVSSLGHIVENSAIVDALMAYLGKASSVVMRKGQPVASLGFEGNPAQEGRSRFAQSQSKRLLTLQDGSLVTARLVVGADGARSSLREMAGLNASRQVTGQQAIVASVHHGAPHQQTARQVFLPTGPLAFLPLAQPGEEDRWCSIVWSADEAEAERLMALSEADFTRALNTAFESRNGAVDQVSQRFAFPLVQRHAERYVAPALALVGDAAHSIHPLAGQGANLGFMDVAVLAEELARAQQRGASIGDIRVLERYARRRQWDNGAMLKLMDAFRIGFGSRLPLARVARNLGLNGVDRLAPIKRLLIRQALGERADLPACMRDSFSLL